MLLNIALHHIVLAVPYCRCHEMLRSMEGIGGSWRMRIDYIAGNWNWSVLAGFGSGVKRGRETLRAFTEAEAIQEFN